MTDSRNKRHGHVQVETNTPSIRPTTVNPGEEIVEPRVENVGRHTVRCKSSVVALGTVIWSDAELLNGGNEYIRDLGCPGVGKILGKLGDGDQHLPLCYGGVDGMEIHDEGENSEQEGASHTLGGRWTERE